MTNKQIETLVLFAQNYPLSEIAKKQGVSLSTIRQRIKLLSKKGSHYKEFSNALALREVYKRNKDAIRNAKNFSSFPDNIDTENISQWGY